MIVHVKVPSESTDTRSKTGQGVTVTGLPEQIKDLLWERIADGTYSPGDRLIETRIARELGVSQGPVREALRQLAGMGLVVFEAHRGCRVRRVDQDELDEVSVVRAALEETAARLAAGRGMAVDRIADEVDGMRSAAVAANGRAWVAHAMAFHRLIVAASGNSTLLSTWEHLSIEGRTAQLVLAPGFDMGASTEQHQVILEALGAGDAERAARLSREHEETFIRGDPTSD